MRLAAAGMRRGLNKATNNHAVQSAPRATFFAGPRGGKAVGAMYTRANPSKGKYHAGRSEGKRKADCRLFPCDSVETYFVFVFARYGRYGDALTLV